MTKNFEKVYDTVMALPKKERALLAEQLLESLPDNERAAIEQAWVAEVEQRFKDVDAGREKLIPGEQVMRDLFARLKK